MCKLKVLFVALCIEGLLVHLYAKEVKYPVSTIPADLKTGARAVIRTSDIVFEVTSIGKAKMTVDYAITILNKNAIEDSYFSEGYDKFSKISNIQAVVYDQAGEKIKRVPADEIIDHSAISGFSIYEDNRAKFINPKVMTVPFTVEYHYEVDFNGILNFPSFIPYVDYDVALENASFKVIVPKNMPLRYYEQNIHTKAAITEIENQFAYFWKEENLKALKSEPFSLPVSEYEPRVVIAPTDFEMDGYKGNAESWENLGHWNLKLLEGKDVLTPETKSTLLKLCENAENENQKIEIIYKYLQENTRYVSIQEGIGGWQPFPAGTTDRLRFGDCKALTNYMKSMLAVVGIKSFYSRVRAGHHAARMKNDFPFSQFNHIFLCVPVQNDTIWLECTSQHDPCGYLGTFTDDRDVLLITGEGGKVVHTPAYSANDNRQMRTAYVELTSNGSGKALLNDEYHGIFYENLQPILLSDDVDKKKMMEESIEIPNFQLISFNHREIRERIPVVIETVDLQLNNYATVMGARLLVPLNLMTKEDLLPRKKEERRSDILIRRSYINIDTIVYKIPQFYKVEGVPASDGVKSDFGEYRYTIEQDGKEIKYIRYLRMDKGQYDKSKYDDLYTFFEKISVMDNVKAVLVRGAN